MVLVFNIPNLTNNKKKENEKASVIKLNSSSLKLSIALNLYQTTLTLSNSLINLNEISLTPRSRFCLNLPFALNRYPRTLSRSQTQSIILYQMLHRNPIENSPSVAVMTSLQMPPFACFQVFVILTFGSPFCV